MFDIIVLAVGCVGCVYQGVKSVDIFPSIDWLSVCDHVLCTIVEQVEKSTFTHTNVSFNTHLK